MQHLQSFRSRKILSVPTIVHDGWTLKRYCILADGREYDAEVVQSALLAALERLPPAGQLSEASGNHGIGFQIIHFAEVAVVSPVYYWIWGSVLANVDQMRAQWNNPHKFEIGVKEVIGCLWELEVVQFEAQSWQNTMLNDDEKPNARLERYLTKRLPSAEKL